MTISVLCGGLGTRLFPLSRELMPKQFASILPKTSKAKSLFAQTLLRNQNALKDHNPKIQIITNETLYFLAIDEAKEIDIKINNFILESCAKNTAPALAIGAFDVLDSINSKSNKAKDSKDSALKDSASKDLTSTSSQKSIQDIDEIILALPSDHIISEKGYKECLEKAIELARQNLVVTFGIKPAFAHTGYGYIQIDSKDKNNVLAFHEKPTLQKAQDFLQKGNYYWNSGMFCFKASVLLEGLKTHAPKIYEDCKNLFEISKTKENSQDCLRLDRNLSKNLQEESIDYALIEKAKNIACVVSDFKWSDVGGFESLSDEYPKDSQNNATNTTFIAKESKNNFIFSSRPIIGIGIEDLIFVDGGDCALISKRGESSKIKEVLPLLKEISPSILQTHSTTHRPWGSYSILLESSGYKIKQIIVKPKSRLSLQKHFHRNEHWIVLCGSALVRVGEKEIFLSANQSTYIPMGEVHRLENPGKIPLLLVEVQVGEYLGEDDIVRLEDDYARK